MTDTPAVSRPLPLAILLILAGLTGLAASFELTLAKFAVLADPDAVLSCDFSILVSCGVNLGSWQGQVFFDVPNPLWGVMGFVAPVAVGTALLAGARFDRWFWGLFNLGLLGAFAFVCWLIGQSIYVLGVLCPWCMVVWAVTIPLFLAVTLRNLAEGVIPAPAGLRSIARSARSWVPLLTLLCYLVIAVLAQLRLDVIDNVF